ncbi:MAG: uracil-DNA glycosylase [Alphaproteobacteria bacterium]
MYQEPEKSCSLCPRLKDFRDENQKQYPCFFNAPVPSFGSLDASILIVGLAPGLKGANATGRPFTGDYAGKLLYSSLKKFNLLEGEYREDPNDGVVLQNCRITNAVKCVPPKNKTTPQEEKNCGHFLIQEIKNMPNLKGIFCLGNTAHSAVLSALGLKKSAVKFKHGAINEIKPETKELNKLGFIMASSYHSSRYNVNTNRITQEMLDDVFEKLLAKI